MVARFQTGHVGLAVSDLDRSRSFYEAVFGLRTLVESEEGERFAFLGYDSEPVLTLWEQGDGFDARRSGLHHLSFQVGSFDRVRETEAAVREQGAEFIYDGPVKHAEGASSGGIYFRDPDGMRLEVFAPDGLDDAPNVGGPACGLFDQA